MRATFAKYLFVSTLAMPLLHAETAQKPSEQQQQDGQDQDEQDDSSQSSAATAPKKKAGLSTSPKQQSPIKGYNGLDPIFAPDDSGARTMPVDGSRNE